MDAKPTLENQAVFLEGVGRLLREIGLGSEFSLQPLPGGGNNRVFQVNTPSQAFLLKVYFRHPGDPRDRLGVEYAFTRFAWEQGIRQGPQAFAVDGEQGLGLYEFIFGKPLLPGEVDRKAVNEALAFYGALNERRHLPEAQKLPVGSEACFCIKDHFHCVDRRLARFEGWSGHTKVESEAGLFVELELKPFWRDLRAKVERDLIACGLDLEEPLSQDRRCLSPSDFGFHNALVEASGTLRFVDFEYAGWDDPAKLACDFFCQPAVPVPEEYWGLFLDEITSGQKDSPREKRRMELLLPVCRVKWINLLLNDFLVTGDQRRRFARPGEDPESRKQEQLEKARKLLGKLQGSPGTPR